MNPNWRKSSYSTSEATSDCVEVALHWRKSSFSTSEPDSMCVEVAGASPAILVRDSKNANGPRLAFARAEFSGLLDRVKSGAFDR